MGGYGGDVESLLLVGEHALDANQVPVYAVYGEVHAVPDLRVGLGFPLVFR
jgi:hypothetical protein